MSDVPFGPTESLPEPDIADRLDHYADAGGVDPVPLREAAAEIRRLRAECERANVLMDKGFSYKELGMKIVNGELRVNAIFDNETEFSPMKFLAAVCWAGLHEGDGNEPANYREGNLEMKIGAGDGDPIRIALAVVKPYRKSPHEHRIVAEGVARQLAAALESGDLEERRKATAAYRQASKEFAS